MSLSKKQEKELAKYQEMIAKAIQNKENFEEFADNLELGLGDIRELKIPQTITSGDWCVPERVPELLVQLCRDPNYIHFVCKYILNIDLLPFQLAVLQTLWTKSLPIFIGSRGCSKSFMLAVYALLRMILQQGCKVAVVGASLRQSMVIFNYIQQIYENAPILRDICGFQGPKRDLHIAYFEIGTSRAVFLPLGNGDKIRGQRANVIICDEFSSISKEVFETVVRGFAAVKSEGVYHHVKKAAKDKALKQLNLESGISQTNQTVIPQFSTALANNQIILSGTPYYQFNHFYQYYKYYRAIILSGGNKEILKKEFPDIKLGGNVNPEDYAIIRLPWDIVPEGMMDASILTQGQATMDPTIFSMEYAACLCPGTQIITNQGSKKIEDIQIGDLVLTHKGRFKKVTKRTFREVDEKIIDLKTFGYSESILATKNHPFWMKNDEFVELDRLTKSTHIVNLKELNNRKVIDIKTFTKNYVEIDNKIYAKSSQNQCSNEMIQEIRNSNKKINELCLIHKMSYSKIWSIINQKTIPKFAVPSKIKINYDLGLIFGYYASEGSQGAKGRAINFALDGHVDAPLVAFVDELCVSIEKVFGLKPKVYTKENVASVVINNRIITDFITKNCTGIATNKFMNPDLLFSNGDFIKGFIKGYFNGDGHKNYKNASASSCSLSLLTQVRLCLSYFNIGSSISFQSRKTAFFRGKEYPTHQSYILLMNGVNYDIFLKTFYSSYKKTLGKQTSIINDGNKTTLTFKSKNEIPYKGLVYNLEVEDDHSYSLHNATVHNCFPSDSEGFYLASSIKEATCPIKDSTGEEILFGAKLIGDKDKIYVLGIDPASEDDNFTMNVIEVNPTYRAVVYQFAINRKGFEELKRDPLVKGLGDINDYNTFCVKHIRDICRRFNIKLICMDSGGGGVSIRESLKDSTKLLDVHDELILDPEDEYSRGLKGKQILNTIEFSKYEWRQQAHHGLRIDILHKKLLFPFYDAAAVEIASLDNKSVGLGVDRLDDCYIEIEQCKQETTLIRHSQTTTGKETWDVPKIIGLDAEEIKKTLKKDRFTSLLLANWAARLVEEELEYAGIKFTGGSVQGLSQEEETFGTAFVGKGAKKMRYLQDNFVTSISASTQGANGRTLYT